MARINRSWLAAGWQAAAVFILLSVSCECLQCYWCGPRAEQVHRRERAPACVGAPDQLADCDPGYTHCAVVATSPPYAESRHCVKFYQDECYAQYCNSTRSFRMTCPCRGDLCNGPNTEREIQAFAALSEIVANARIKRNTITSSSFISAGKAKMNLIDNDEQENADTNNVTSDAALSEPTVGAVDNSSKSSGTAENEANTTPEPKADLFKTDESTVEVVEEIPVEVVSTAESLKLESTTTKTPETSMKPAETMKDEVNELVNNDVKPSMQLPTAEALQQNASPVVTTEKTMEQTTGPPTVMTTVDNENESPSPTESKNKSVVACLSTFIFISSLSFNVCS